MKGKGNEMDRRRFIGAAAAASVAASSGCSARAPDGVCPAAPAKWNVNSRRPSLADLSGAKRPNVLFILTDQERWPGNLPPTLNRPNFERLRSSAVSFENAFCAYPLCSPSRSAIFTGQFPHQTGITQNCIFPVGKKPLEPSTPHVGSVLASAGYRVAYKGKWDLSRGPRYYMIDVTDRGRAGDLGYEGHCGKVPDQEYGYRADDMVVRESADWIRANGKDGPWFLCCSIINPHDICHPQLKPDDSIRPDVELPASLHDDLSNKPADQRKMRDGRLSHVNHLLHPSAKPFSRYEENDWRLFLSFYYDLIERTDSYIGDLLAALEDAGAAEDTVVIYSSDHGELGGAHGFSGKYEGYEEDLHVPLYVHHPSLRRAEVDALVSNVSIAPTIASIGGIDWPVPIPGRDLSGWVTGEGERPAPEAVFSETEVDVELGVYRRRQATRMIRTGDWKYSYSFHDVQDGQLYDLSADPAEMNNLFHDPGHAGMRSELEDRLAAWQEEWDDYFRLPGK